MFDSIASSSRTSNNFIWSPTRSSPHASISCFVPLSARKRSPFPLMFCSVRRRKVRKICLTFFRATCVFHSVEFDFSLPLNLAATVSLKLLFIHSKTSKTLISSAFVHVPRLLTAVAIFFRPFSPQRTLSSSSLV